MAADDAIADADELFTDLDELAGETASETARAEIRELKALIDEARLRGVVDSGVRTLDPSDVVEAFIGAVIFGSPLLIEDGVFDIANYLFTFDVAGFPVFLAANTVFVVVMTYALVEWTGRNSEDSEVLFGVVPVRVLMILAVSLVVAAGLMTVWGRVGDWQPPSEAVARINVVWTVAAFGAALGDILPGESSGDDINDDLGDLADLVEEFVD